MLPPEGPVLVLGVGNRRVTADALGPRTVQKVFVTMGPHTVPVQGIRPVAAVAPGVSAATGLSLQQLAGALVRELRPAALLCVDSLCSAEPERLGRTPCEARHRLFRHCTNRRYGFRKGTGSVSGITTAGNGHRAGKTTRPGRHRAACGRYPAVRHYTDRPPAIGTTPRQSRSGGYRKSSFSSSQKSLGRSPLSGQQAPMAVESRA